MELKDMLLDIEQQIDIKAPRDVVFAGVLEEISGKMHYPDGTSMNHKIEAWPGGRWYRDLGDNTGHYWGTVQSIKPPALLEIIGPMFMSYPVTNHVEFKLTEHDGGTRLSFRHRAIGLLQAEHAAGVKEGWGEMLRDIKASAEG